MIEECISFSLDFGGIGIPPTALAAFCASTQSIDSICCSVVDIGPLYHSSVMGIYPVATTIKP
jgi:hypothetical protein